MRLRWTELVLVALLAAPACRHEKEIVPNGAEAPVIATAPEARTVPAVLVAARPDPVAATEPEPPVAEPDSDAPAAVAESPLPGGKVRSAKEYFATLDRRFQSAAAKDLHAVFDFDLSGPNACAYHVQVDDGVMQVESGRAVKADVTIAASAEDYIKVVNGELGGVGAVLARKMKIGGNLTLARRMSKMFPAAHADN